MTLSHLLRLRKHVDYPPTPSIPPPHPLTHETAPALRCPRLQCVRVSVQDKASLVPFVPPAGFPSAALLYAEVQGLNDRYVWWFWCACPIIMCVCVSDHFFGPVPRSGRALHVALSDSLQIAATLALALILILTLLPLLLPPGHFSLTRPSHRHHRHSVKAELSASDIIERLLQLFQGQVCGVTSCV